MAQSVAPLVAGFAMHDPAVPIAGVILNRVGSARHETLLRRALAPLGIPVLGAVPRASAIATPSRHLGLVQAGERADLDRFLEDAGALVAAHVDLDALAALAAPLPAPQPARPCRRRRRPSPSPTIRPLPLPIRIFWRTGAPPEPRYVRFHRWPTIPCPEPI